MSSICLNKPLDVLDTRLRRASSPALTALLNTSAVRITSTVPSLPKTLKFAKSSIIFALLLANLLVEPNTFSLIACCLDIIEFAPIVLSEGKYPSSIANAASSISPCESFLPTPLRPTAILKPLATPANIPSPAAAKAPSIAASLVTSRSVCSCVPLNVSTPSSSNLPPPAPANAPIIAPRTGIGIAA